jgi:hypothetical protein
MLALRAASLAGGKLSSFRKERILTASALVAFEAYTGSTKFPVDELDAGDPLQSGFKN